MEIQKEGILWRIPLASFVKKNEVPGILSIFLYFSLLPIAAFGLRVGFLVTVVVFVGFVGLVFGLEYLFDRKPLTRIGQWLAGK